MMKREQVPEEAAWNFHLGTQSLNIYTVPLALYTTLPSDTKHCTMNFCSVHLSPLLGEELDHACPQHLAQYLFGPYKALLN